MQKANRVLMLAAESLGKATAHVAGWQVVNRALLQRLHPFIDVDGFAGDPAWVRTLADLLGSRDSADETVLDVHTALVELRTWLNHPTNDKAPASDWDSLAADVQMALSGVGPAVGRKVPGLAALHGRMEAGLKRVMEAPSVREKLLADTSQVLSAVTSAGVLPAWWDDIIEDAQDLAVPLPTLRWRVRSFFQALSVLGHDASWKARDLEGILRDHALPVDEARFRLGESDSGAVLSSPYAPAGLSLGERLDLARRVIELPPQRGDVVVWVLFDCPEMGRVFVDVGPVRFIDARWVLARLDSGSVDAKLAPELEDPSNHRGFADLDRETRGVLARVEMTDCLVAGASEIARANAQALVTLAGFRSPRSNWAPRRGGVTFLGGELRGWHWEPRHMPDWPMDDGMDDELERLAKEIGSKLPVADERLSTISDALANLGRSRTLPEIDQVAVLIRLLELARTTADLGDADWTSFVSDRLRGRWVHRQLRNRLIAVCLGPLSSPFPGGTETEPELERLGQLRDLALSGAPWNLKVVADIVAMVADEYRDTGLHARELEETAAVFRSGEVLSREVEILDAEFATLLKRSKRVRNAILHGGAFTEAVLTPLTPFLRSVCVDSLNRIVAALLAGLPVVQEYAKEALKDELMRATARAGGDPGEVMFSSR